MRHGKIWKEHYRKTGVLADAADGRDGVSYSLVFKLSRFGRDAADVPNSLQYIQDYGVNLICAEDGIDSSKDSGNNACTGVVYLC